MLDQDQTTSDTAETAAPATAPRRRRAASRPAGPPVERPTDGPDSSEALPAAGEPPAADQAFAATDDAPAATDQAPAATQELAVAPDEGRPKRTRRTPAEGTRRRKAAAAAEPAAEGDSAAEPAEQPSTDPADPVGESLQALARSRRRASRPQAAPEAAQALDQLAAALGAESSDDSADSEREPAKEETVEQDEVIEEESAESDDDDADDADDEDDADDTGEVGESPRRRRRRRGGRRRRRAGDSPAEGDGSEDQTDADSDEEEGDEPEGETAAGATETSTSSRRRRRRRRRGEDAGAAEDDPTEVVVRVREPRRARSTNEEVTGIDGSTRMEAKRQRRREGRAAGRRRAPILSEAEFLARRESVDRKMLIRQSEDYTQIAVLEDGILVEHYVDRASAASMIGNVYLGRVQNVLPSMEAAFIDIGRGRNAVLYAGEVDWDAFGVTGGDRKMEKVFKSGQSVLVQVSKDPVGAKGARLTAHVSIPGRYVVYSPSGQLSGISRKLSETERNRLKGILDGLVGEDASVIVRTAAEGASEDELVRDVNRLKAQWEVIEKKVKAGKSPELLYAEPDLTVRIVRDLFTEDFNALIVDGNSRGEDAFDTVDAYVGHVAPHLKERLSHWNHQQSGDLFGAHRIDEQIAKALERKVFLPSGGSLIIDRTEAMTVIDVNTGKFTGTSGNLEATVTSNNLEAAEEIVRQLRLRDVGGIIVIDFIDMVLPSNRELLLRRLVECLGRDRTRHQVAEVTSLGLVQMTRKKIGTGLAEAFTVVCETCKGRGYHRHDTPVESQAPADGGERDNHRRGRRN